MAYILSAQDTSNTEHKLKKQSISKNKLPFQSLVHQKLPIKITVFKAKRHVLIQAKIFVETDGKIIN